MIEYHFPVNLASTGEILPLTGLPPGRYLASYSVSLQPFSTAITGVCYFQGSGGSSVIDSVGTESAVFGVAILSSTGVLDTRAETYTCQCTSVGGSFIWGIDEASTVTLLRLDHVESK